MPKRVDELVVGPVHDQEANHGYLLNGARLENLGLTEPDFGQNDPVAQNLAEGRAHTTAKPFWLSLTKTAYFAA